MWHRACMLENMWNGVACSFSKGCNKKEGVQSAAVARVKCPTMPAFPIPRDNSGKQTLSTALAQGLDNSIS